MSHKKFMRFVYIFTVYIFPHPRHSLFYTHLQKGFSNVLLFNFCLSMIMFITETIENI